MCHELFQGEQAPPGPPSAFPLSIPRFANGIESGLLCTPCRQADFVPAAKQEIEVRKNYWSGGSSASPWEGSRGA